MVCVIDDDWFTVWPCLLKRPLFPGVIIVARQKICDKARMFVQMPWLIFIWKCIFASCHLFLLWIVDLRVNLICVMVIDSERCFQISFCCMFCVGVWCQNSRLIETMGIHPAMLDCCFVTWCLQFLRALPAETMVDGLPRATSSDSVILSTWQKKTSLAINMFALVGARFLFVLIITLRAELL